MAKINCLNPIAKCGMDLFNDKYETTNNYEEASAVLVRSASMHDLNLSENLVAVARAGAGVNNIPLDKCAENGVVVFNTPGANANGVKELVIAGLLLASRDIIGGYNWVKENASDVEIAKAVEKQKAQFGGFEISGKKLGVIGLGAIGAKVANIAIRLGMEVYGYDPFVSVDAAWSLSKHVKRILNLDEIYSECDFISLHVPFLDQTKHMINSESIKKMKDGVKILNFSRDALVNDNDMIEALNNNKISKYVTDFPNHTVAGCKNVITLPHLGASTEESEDNCAIMAVNQIMDFIENGTIKNSVNYPDCNAGVCKSATRLTICHKNIPNMINTVTGTLAKKSINVSDMVSKSRGDFAYTVLDVDSDIDESIIQEINDILDVIKVRKI